MSDGHPSQPDTWRSWLDLMTPDSLLHGPVQRQRARAVMTVWLFLVAFGVVVTTHLALSAQPTPPVVVVILLTGLVCAALSPILLRRTGNWRLASAFLVSAGLALSATRAITTTGPAFDVLTYIILLPIVAYLCGALGFGVFTALACSVVVYVMTATTAGGGQIGALAAPWLGLTLAIALRRLLRTSYEQATHLSQRLSDQESTIGSTRDRVSEAERAKGEFLANMSHEIRTPLNGVIGMSTLLMDTQLDTQQRDYAETIRTSSEALLTVINDVLDFSKVDAGQLSLVEQPVDLTRLIDQVAQLFAQQAATAGVELVTDIAPDVPRTIVGDEGRLRQILVNLIGNAVKFTPSGEIVIRLAIDETRENSVILGFEVQDTGAGVAEEAQSRLFEEFFQADTSSTRMHGGTGLGLAICARLVKVMGGQIGVDSTLGLGSTFWFTAPVKRLDGESHASPFALSPGLRVLVVDDNATQRDVMAARIETWGAHPIAAASAAEAMDLLVGEESRRTPIDLAIIDLHMPGTNGIELSQTIQATQRSSALPVLLMTSVGFNVDRSAYRVAGIRHAIPKPIRWTQLYELMTDIPRRAPEIDVVRTEEADETATDRHVLIVEDNAVNQKVARHMLESLGYTADVVSNGVQAIEAWQHTRYVSVLMDIHMPVMNGLDATRDIRRLEADSETHTPIIAMTADVLPADRKRCLDAGMDAHLPKPMQIETLEPLLRYWTAMGNRQPTS